MQHPDAVPCLAASTWPAASWRGRGTWPQDGRAPGGNVLAKLGLRIRAEAAAYATRQDISP